MSNGFRVSRTPAYALPPKGRPLGTNIYFRVCSKIVIPLLKALTKRDWRGMENLPKTGAVIVACNHMSYADPLVFAHYLYANGRAPRFLGKESVFRVPVIGTIVSGAGQIPVHRESDRATEAVDHALNALSLGHCLGIYPEGTLTRDPDLWPMVAKTGLARLALKSRVPVIPFAQWGDQDLLPRYGKRVTFWKRTTVTIIAGSPVDLSEWFDQADNHDAQVAATQKVMKAITTLLEEIRGESAPTVIFDPHQSELPRVGKFTAEKSAKARNRK